MVGGIVTPTPSACTDSDADSPQRGAAVTLTATAHTEGDADDDGDSVTTPFYLMDSSSRVASLMAMWEEDEQDPDSASLQLQPSISFDEEADAPTPVTKHAPAPTPKVIGASLPQRQRPQRSKQAEPERLTIIDAWDRRINSPPSPYPVSNTAASEGAGASTAATSSSSASTAGTPTTTDDESDSGRCQPASVFQRPRRGRRCKPAGLSLPTPDAFCTGVSPTTPARVASDSSAAWQGRSRTRSFVPTHDAYDGSGDGAALDDDMTSHEAALCPDLHDDWAMAKSRGERNYKNKLRGRNKPFRFRDDPFGVKNFNRKRRTALRQLKTQLHGSEDEHERLPASLPTQQYHELYSGATEGADVYNTVTHPCQQCGAVFIPSRNQRRKITRVFAQQRRGAGHSEHSQSNANDSSCEKLHQGKKHHTSAAKDHSTTTDVKGTGASEGVSHNTSSPATASPTSKDTSSSKAASSSSSSTTTTTTTTTGDSSEKKTQQGAESLDVDTTMMCPACRRVIAEAQRKRRRKARAPKEPTRSVPRFQYPICLSQTSKNPALSLLQALEQSIPTAVSEGGRSITSTSVKRTPVHDEVVHRFLERLQTYCHRHKASGGQRRLRFRGKGRRKQRVQPASAVAPGAGEAAAAATGKVVFRITFHGTPESNHSSIYRRGLVVPGASGVRVANGSVHGLGIYSSSQLSTARIYARGTRKLFACALIDDSACCTSNVSRYGSIFVTKNPAHICPLWTIPI